MSNDMGGLIYNTQKRPNRTGSDAVEAGGDFSPETDNYFNPAGWQDPGPLDVRQRAESRRDGARVQGVQRRPDPRQELRS